MQTNVFGVRSAVYLQEEKEKEVGYEKNRTRRYVYKQACRQHEKHL